MHLSLLTHHFLTCNNHCHLTVFIRTAIAYFDLLSLLTFALFPVITSYICYARALDSVRFVRRLDCCYWPRLISKGRISASIEVSAAESVYEHPKGRDSDIIDDDWVLSVQETGYKALFSLL
jgi:hypothetical protein